MGWNDDGLHKRGKTIYVSYRDPVTGKSREKSTGTSDYRKAKEFKRRFDEALHKRELPTEMAQWPLKKAVDRYIEYRSAIKPENTWKTERTLFRPVCRFLGDSRVLRTITPADLRDYQVYRTKCVHPRTKKLITNRSINYELYCLIKILEQANLWNDVFRRQYKRLRVVKAAVGTALQPQDASHLFAVAQTRDSWLVAFLASLVAYAAGCRSNEIKTLALGRIDLAGSQFTVLPTCDKTRRGRPVALNLISRWGIERLIERARLLGATAPEHYLLPLDRAKSNKLSPAERALGFDPTRHQRSWASAWRSLRKAAGMDGFRFHDLRHTFNTQCAELCGGSPDIIMKQVGHLNEDMRQHYLHISDRAQHALVKQVASANGPVLDVLGISPD